jgi:hypothetical protein
VLRCSSGLVGEGAFVRNCRGIGTMVVLHKFGVADYSVSGSCGVDRGSGAKGRGWQGGEGGEKRREWRKWQK